mgnify:CR=1 FL=1
MVPSTDRLAGLIAKWLIVFALIGVVSGFLAAVTGWRWINDGGYVLAGAWVGSTLLPELRRWWLK